MLQRSSMNQLNDSDWRPITFQGVTFPPTLMAISVLEPILDLNDEEFGSWLWRFTICRGVTKSAPADRCARCAQKAIDLMLEHRQRILDGIRARCGPLGFDPEQTYCDWITSLHRIVELSRASGDECVWSAPSHPHDDPQSAAKILAALELARARPLK
jgi:hypothetical protein